MIAISEERVTQIREFKRFCRVFLYLEWGHEQNLCIPRHRDKRGNVPIVVTKERGEFDCEEKRKELSCFNYFFRNVSP